MTWSPCKMPMSSPLAARFSSDDKFARACVGDNVLMLDIKTIWRAAQGPLCLLAGISKLPEMRFMNSSARLLAVATACVGLTTAHLLYPAEIDIGDIKSEITKRHDEAVKRLQDWIGQVSIAAEDRGYPEGAEYMAKLARDAGFQQATVIKTDGRPGVFATLDAGAPKTVGLYFMYDVKQFDPAEWTSPPTEARIVDKPPLGKVMIGRGAVNQKGPEAAFLAALHAIRGAGKKMPVNLVMVAEGEEEIGSPHIPQLVRRPEVLAALKKCGGVFMPFAAQDLDGVVTVSLGAKGVVELELVSSGEKWGRGPAKDIHSSLKAMVDSPAWHLVKALDTLVSEDGNEITIDKYPKPHPLSTEEKAIIEKVSKVRSESQPTVNIEGLVGGYTGPGGKTILPHRAVAKIDMRLVPDMKAADALAALREHLAKRGFGDIEVNMTGGYDPTSTSADSPLIKAQVATYKEFGIDPLLWPRNAGSYPGYVFTAEPLKLAAGHFGLGHGSGAHAPDEYYVIESANPKVQGFDGAVMSFVEYLYELAK